MLFVARHGETDWNLEHRLQGRTDIPLNENGRNQMRQAGLALREQGFQVDKIVCSPLKRASETAAILGQSIGYTGEISPDEDLLERSFGTAEGLLITPELDVTDPKYSMESAEHLCQRIQRVLDRYSADPDRHVLMVTHGAFIMATMDYLAGNPLRTNYQTLPKQGNPVCISGEVDPENFSYALKE